MWVQVRHRNNGTEVGKKKHIDTGGFKFIERVENEF